MSGVLENPGEEGKPRSLGGDSLRQDVSKSILMLLFKKEIEKGEGKSQEIHLDIQGSIKQDRLGNYICSLNGKKILLDENLNDLTGLEFVGITPFNDRYYIGDIGKKCIFFDTQTGNIVEFVEGENSSEARYYGSDKLCDDEFLVNLCKSSIKLYPGMNEKELFMGFAGFSRRYLRFLWEMGLSDDDLEKEVSDYRGGSLILYFLKGAYEYMYNGKITNSLAGKNGKFRTKLKECEILKEWYPDLYLAMVELEDIRNVIIDENGEIYGYVKVKDGACYYVQANGDILKYDNFEGPDENGFIITTQGNKKYFINDTFQYPYFGFDEIVGPDKNKNYLLKFEGKVCFYSTAIGRVVNVNNEFSEGNEPSINGEVFNSVIGPDENNNYIVQRFCSSYLLNSEGSVIAGPFYSLEYDGSGKYLALNMEDDEHYLDNDGKKISKS